jgi:hypothetical protein
MIKNMHKKGLIILSLCFFANHHVFCMDKKMEEFKQSLHDGTKNTDQLCVMAAELAKNNKKHFQKISLLTHPDKNNNDINRAAIFQAAYTSYNPDNPTLQQEITPEEKKYQKIISKISDAKQTLDSINTYSLPMAAILERSEQIQQEISHALIDNAVETTFGIILKKLAPGCTGNTELQDILNDIKNKNTTMNNVLTMHADYRTDLQKTTNKNYDIALKKLSPLHKKEKQ